MTKYRDTLQYLAFIEALKQRFRWEIPCINTPSDIFEIEKLPKDKWKYRLKGNEEWIDSSTLSILAALDRNDVNLSFFKQQLRESILSTAVHSYDVVQEACNLIGEDNVYAKIEDEHSRLEEEVEHLIEGDLDFNSLLKVVRGSKKE